MSETTSRAERVERLLNDPDFKQALADTRNAILERFAQIPPSEAEQLVECRKFLHALDSVEANLKAAISAGKLETFRAEQERTGFLQDASKLWRKKA